VNVPSDLDPALLRGQRALITGGSRGLGQALCRVFADHGARVAFTWSRDAESAKATEALLATRGGGLSLQASVLDVAATRAAVRRLVDGWGGIDILVNNAGISQVLPFPLVEEEDWDRVMDVNVKGTFLTTREVLRPMFRQKSGVILNIGSLAGVRLIESPVHYAASKAAIAGFTRALSKEVARQSIRVNCLAPGLLEDGMGRNLPEHRLQDYLHHTPLGRVGTVEEVARFAAFLVSDACSYLNGQVVVMDGGL
jgi:NAD(P)-dependent dehydrogenase (short-subunit alcohol dehydrogenase family)